MKSIFILIFILCFGPCSAQNTMCVNYKDGHTLEIPIDEVDCVTFTEKEPKPDEASLVGTWMWGRVERGYYEVLTFNEDATYLGYDYYMDYGFDTNTYGTYYHNGIMLNLWSNGYGYRRIYRWFVTSLTENALEVMTQMGSFVYYRVQPGTIALKVGEQKECEEGSAYVFADGMHVGIEGNKLTGKMPGVSYVQKYNAAENVITAHKVTVEH